MVDVYIVVYTLLGILICLPALLLALNLLMPKITQRIETRLEKTPGKSFVLGVPVTAAFLLWIAITANIPGLGQGSAFLAAFVGMGLGTLGAAGMSRLLAKRVQVLVSSSSEALSLLRGAVMYELACLFPIVGWFLFAPVVGITVIGAAVFGLLGWLPRPSVSEQVVVASQQ
ncbi:hypothetical protein [Candidatus Leptofilum sp.]|uniref:hypothetical protein n=1 Tax=Candidatus Leptofilum sp. TaxID=3241576 RepID=UPI003B5CE150